MPDARDTVQFVKHWLGSSLETPEISVLIPCWYGEQTIAGALDSIEAQTFFLQGLAVEIIIVADGRQEDACAVEEWIQRRGKTRRSALTLVHLAVNVGAGASRQLGYSYCQGKFLAFLDDDDIWHSSKLLIQWRWHQDNPGAIASGHGYGERVAERERSFVRLLIGNCPIKMPTIMINRALWLYEPEPYRYAEDWLMLVMIANAAPIKVLPGKLAWRSELAPPVGRDPHSLSRNQFRLRRGQFWAVVVLTRRAVLSPAWLPVILAWFFVLATRRFLLDLHSSMQ